VFTSVPHTRIWWWASMVYNSARVWGCSGGDVNVIVVVVLGRRSEFSVE
jgi:hypothetical protein